MKSTPVKIECSRTLVIRNISKIPAIFRAFVNEPFTVKPLHGKLNSQQTMTITIKFKSNNLDNYQSYLKILYETGETLAILLEADTVNENITLETNFIEFPDTFMTLQSFKNIKLFNSSDHVVNYQWKLYPYLNDDCEEFDKLKRCFRNITDRDYTRYCNLEMYDIIHADKHHEVCDRIYNDEVDECEKKYKLFLYKNAFFQIIPKVNFILQFFFGKLLSLFYFL